MVDAANLLVSRWRGQPGRLDVWYATFTDVDTGDGYWLHHELLAPTQGDPYTHGWIAAFPVNQPPMLARFGPRRAHWPLSNAGFHSPDAQLDAASLRGAAGSSRWDLSYQSRSLPLYPFPRWAWEREALPAAQVVSAPNAIFTGDIEVNGRTASIRGARGAVARIYGHGNAHHWAWLHADLGGDDAIEVILAVSRRGALRWLRPLAFVQLRLDGVDWPVAPSAGLPYFKGTIGLPTWSVWGNLGTRKLKVDVTIPPENAISLTYRDPDGAQAVCTNSERASAHITLLSRHGFAWSTREWRLDGTAHAEVGQRAT